MTASSAHEPPAPPAGHGSHEPHPHVDRTAAFLKVFGLLCVLTALSFCTYFDFWKHNVPERSGWTMMMAVAVCKALLVALFFMHLRWEAAWKYVLTLPTLLMAAILIVALIPDFGLRLRRYDAARKAAAAEIAAPKTPAPAH